MVDAPITCQLLSHSIACHPPTVNKKKKISASGPTWAEDKSADFCQSCGFQFNVLIRRHHCRHCGHLFCRYCAQVISRHASNRPELYSFTRCDALTFVFRRKNMMDFLPYDALIENGTIVY